MPYSKGFLVFVIDFYQFSLIILTICLYFTSHKPTLNPTSNDKAMDKLKTSALSRQLSLAKTSLNIGKNLARHSLGTLFMDDGQKQAQKQAFMQVQADYLVGELGKLKGSVVKIGQMLALYGETMLPAEIVQALHTLDSQTRPLSFEVIYDAIYRQIGDKIHELDIDHRPIGTASLAQVHKATIKGTSQTLALKVQYPNIASAIDSDLSFFKHLLKVSNVVPQTRMLDAWFDEVSTLLHTEVDYEHEATTTERFFARLADNEHYIVPQIYRQYSTKRLLAMSFEQGVSFSDPQLANLPQDRRNHIGQMALNIVIKEIFDYQEMQTDPNFGNYLVRLHDDKPDQLVLLDFGAVKKFDDTLVAMAKRFIKAGFLQDKTAMIQAMIDNRHHYEFFNQMSDKARADIADVFLTATEGFASADILQKINPALLDTSPPSGRYIWAKSDLYNRAIMRAKNGMTSLEFSVPPKEMMFISRKFIGAYALLCAIDARTDSHALLGRYVA